MPEPEPVGLVPGPLEQLQAGIPPGQRDGEGTARDEDLLLPLREADGGELDSDPVERREGRRELALSAVDDEQVGERLALGAPPFVAPGHGLGDRREVVRHRPLDPERPVLVLRRRPVDEDDAGRIRVAPLEVGDVEALDAGRATIEVERLRERERRLLPCLPKRPEAPHVARPRVVPGDPHAVERGAALRGPDRHLRPAPVRQPGLERLERFLRDLEREVDLPRQERRRVVVLREERDPELLRVDLAEPLPEELPRVEDRPAADVEDGDRDVPAVGEVPEHVDVLPGERLDALLLRQLLHRPEAVPVGGGHLVLLRLGRGVHLRGEARRQLLVPPREEEDDVPDGVVVGRLRRQARDARPEAGVHVVVEAGARKRAVDLDAAGADLEHPLHHLHRPAAGARRQERPEVAVPVLQDAARDVGARPLLPRRHLDVRVGLVVPQQDVVAGLVLLDEGVLEGEGLALGVRDDRVDRLELGEERLGLRVLRPGREVRREAPADRPRLADVEDLPLRVAVEVDPRLVGIGGKVGRGSHGGILGSRHAGARGQRTLPRFDAIVETFTWPKNRPLASRPIPSETRVRASRA
jgi:hypothetical protein